MGGKMIILRLLNKRKPKKRLIELKCYSYFQIATAHGKSTQERRDNSVLLAHFFVWGRKVRKNKGK